MMQLGCFVDQCVYYYEYDVARVRKIIKLKFTTTVHTVVSPDLIFTGKNLHPLETEAQIQAYRVVSVDWRHHRSPFSL